MKNNQNLLFFFLLLSCNLWSQKEANIWYFGYKAGVDFSGPTPIALTNGKDSTREGCSTICTNTGSLLFYTNGVKVWDRLHNPMPNGTGLMGHNSSTQSSIIIPKPGSSTIFYIFTTDAVPDGSGKGLRYSELDMSLNGGYGDITSTKNVFLANSTEKLTAVKHKNNNDIWVIAFNYQFLVFSVSNLGVNTMPIYSTGGSGTASIGCLKASPDGKYLASANAYGQSIDMLKFNDTTGIVTPYFSFSPPTCLSMYGELPYGVEFSPDCTRLYLGLSGNGCNNIYQYDLTLNTIDAIIASKTIIGTASGTDACGSLQIAPNGKIYIARHQVPYLACINNPNALGVSCNFVNNAVNLLGRWSILGLENVIQSYFNFRHISYFNTCLNTPTTFSLSDTIGVDSVRWNFNDPATGTLNSSSLFTPTHLFSSSGTYNVSAIVFSGILSDTLSVSINIYDSPHISLGTDTTICSGVSIPLNAGSGNTLFEWQDGSILQTFNAISSGIYWVKVSNGCGSDIDSIIIKQNFLFNVRDTVICSQNDSITLSVNGNFLSYLWSDSSNAQSVLINEAGVYWVKMTTICGDFFDTIHVSEYDCDVQLPDSFPNIFSPNNDGTNDFFVINNLPENTITSIYNRWGIKVFETNETNNFWDGSTTGGEICNEGIYYYIISTVEKNYNGFLQLVR